MKTKQWLFYYLLFLAMVIFAVSGCESDDDDTVVSTTNPEVISTFTETNSTVLAESIIDLPDSLIISSSSSSNIHEPLYAQSGSSDSGLIGIYSGIRQYVGLAEMMKNQVKTFMQEIVKSSILQTAALDTEYTIPDDPSEPNAPKKFMVQKPTDEDYEWKLSLYFSASATDPEMIIRFTISDGSAEGRMKWKIVEEAEELTAANIIGVEVTRYLDVTFDGTANPKTLDVKVIQDSSEYRTYATDNWSDLTETQKTALDLGQPEKVFLTASYNSTTELFTIYGTSYHPGWETEATLNGENMTWGDDRSMYMFKAIADVVNEGAKLYLSIPLETRNDASDDVWTDDSISTVFGQMMLDDMNATLETLADATDDVDTDGDSGANLTLSEEQERADFLRGYLLYEPITPPHEYSIDEYNLAKTYFSGGHAFETIFTLYSSASTFSAFVATLPLASADETDQSNVYYWMMAAQADNTATNSGSHEITLAQLETFVSWESDANTQSLKDAYKSISYLINPAFYSDTEGFIGTYDSETETFYEYTGTAMTEASDTDAIVGLVDLDLSNITSHIPAEVKAATITID